MLVELKAKSQLTMPSEIVKSLNLTTGSQFEVNVVDGIIQFVPVVVYPEHVVNRWKAEIHEAKEALKNGDQAVYDSIDSLLEELNISEI